MSMCLADYDVARGIAGNQLRSILRKRRSTHRARAGAAAAAVVALLLLGGCGGDNDGAGQTTAAAVTEASRAEASTDPAAAAAAASDEPSGDPASDRKQIKATLTSVLTGTDPKKICDTLVTARYLEQAYGGRSGCIRGQSKKAAADKLEIGEIAISPEAVASTSVRVKGGIYDKQRLRTELVLQGGEWKLDSLSSNVPVGP